MLPPGVRRTAWRRHRWPPSSLPSSARPVAPLVESTDPRASVSSSLKFFIFLSLFVFLSVSVYHFSLQDSLEATCAPDRPRLPAVHPDLENGAQELKINLKDDLCSNIAEGIQSSILLQSISTTTCWGAYFQEGNKVKMEMTVHHAYQRSIQTLFNWLHKEVNTSKTHVIFRAYAPVHFRGGDWRSGGSCHLETLVDATPLKSLEAWADQLQPVNNIFGRSIRPNFAWVSYTERDTDDSAPKRRSSLGNT